MHKSLYKSFSSKPLFSGLTKTFSSPPLLAIIIFSLGACQTKKEDIKDFQNAIEAKVKKTVDQFSNDPQLPIDELKKLSQLEYKMLRFPHDVEETTIEESLNELGEERWDCFSSAVRPMKSPENPELIVLCKRFPETPLRFIPRSILGR